MVCHTAEAINNINPPTKHSAHFKMSGIRGTKESFMVKVATYIITSTKLFSCISH